MSGLFIILKAEESMPSFVDKARIHLHAGKGGDGAVAFHREKYVAAGESVKFDQVLAVVDGEEARFGAPVLEGATVTANVVKNGKSAKVRVYKMKPKKGYRRTQGHRQPYTKVQIEAINA